MNNYRCNYVLNYRYDIILLNPKYTFRVLFYDIIIMYDIEMDIDIILHT